MSERLYYTDSFLTEFDGAVVGVVEAPRPALILDRTAFYPTSGGQVNDTGWIDVDGHKWRVVEVAERDDGEVLHFLAPIERGAGEGPAKPGAAPTLRAGMHVHGAIDFPRRRQHMQQHSGQHVLSAAFVRLFEMPTVSFHMGDETCSVDLATSALQSNQMERASELANQVVFEDRAVEIRFATMDEAGALGVRKLPEHVEGKLRLIDIRDFDLTACGGTHVRATGQIGPILLRKLEKVRQGVRVEFVCGERAVALARRDFTTITEAAALYSAHIWELPQQIRKSLDEVKAAGKQQHRLLEEIAELTAARLFADAEQDAGFKLVARVFPDRDTAFIKLLAQKLTANPGVVALLGSTLAQPALVFATSAGLAVDMGALLKETLSAAGGRGGGSRDMAQGGVPAGTDAQELIDAAVTRLRG